MTTSEQRPPVNDDNIFGVPRVLVEIIPVRKKMLVKMNPAR